MTANQELEPVEVARNPWAVAVLYDAWQTLELRWLPGGMTDDDFKDTLLLFAGEGERHKPRFMIIDSTEFHHQPGPEVMRWRDERIVPRYEASGVTKFAFLVPKEFPGTVEAGGKPARQGSASFPTAWFSSREHAYQWLADEPKFPAPTQGIALTQFIVSKDMERSRRFYVDVLGGETVLDGEPTIVALANAWITIGSEGGPTEDKPSVTLETPRDHDRVSSFLNIRVADIDAIYKEWSSRGAQFLTPPVDRGVEIRCYMRDPDGHLIEVGQVTGNLDVTGT